jgi:hypothetical protein
MMNDKHALDALRGMADPTLAHLEDETRPRVVATAIGATVEGDLPPEDLFSAINRCVGVGLSWQWWVGDLLNWGEGRYGKAYMRASLNVSGFSDGYMLNLKSWAARIPLGNRRPDVRPTTQFVVARLKDPEEQRKWLEIAARERLSGDELRLRLRGESGRLGEGGADDKESEFPSGKRRSRGPCDVLWAMILGAGLPPTGALSELVWALFERVDDAAARSIIGRQVRPS